MNGNLCYKNESKVDRQGKNRRWTLGNKMGVADTCISKIDQGKVLRHRADDLQEALREERKRASSLTHSSVFELLFAQFMRRSFLELVHRVGP